MATLKTCFKCGNEKPLTEFYRHKRMGDGHLNKCKECTKSDVSAHRAANIDAVRSYDRARGKLPHRIEKSILVGARWRAEFPERRSANTALGNAVRSGAVLRQPCWVCGEKAEAHHPCYSQPLDVVWLCPAHHKQTHAIVRNAA